jgi:UDP-glucose 4-epimerase
MARCLVTGHRGYIGSAVYKKLKELDHEVLGLDLFDGHNIIKDLAEYNEPMRGKFHPLYSNFKPEYIFHLACIPRVEYSVEYPVETMKNNVLATTHILNFARKIGAKRVIYSGSSSVDGNGNGPTSPYGLQKLISEMECKLYSDLYDLDTVSLRYFNVYSEDQPADGPYSTAIANWMKYIKEGKTPFITGNGTQRRDMAYIEDIVSANIFAMEHKGHFNGRHYDVGTGENISLNQIKKIVLKYFPNVVFDYTKPRPGDVDTTCANMLELKELGWKPKVKIYDGINKCFKKLKEELNER